MSDLDRAVQTVVRRCLAIRAGENVLVIGDEGTYDLAEALRAEASAAGADAVLALMDARAENGTEPPPPIAAALSAVDVYIAPTTKSLSHTRARKAASEAGVRGATLPGVTAELLARVMAVDFDALAERSHAVAELLTAAGEARISCPARHRSAPRPHRPGRHRRTTACSPSPACSGTCPAARGSSPRWAARASPWSPASTARSRASPSP